MWHTLQEAIELTGRSRRSLYRDMDAGRVSYRVRNDRRRELETTELMRAYGALRAVAQPAATEAAQAGTALETSPELVAALLDELRLLREEVAGLRAAMLRLEHKPEPEAAPEPAPERRPVKSFADLLDSL